MCSKTILTIAASLMIEFCAVISVDGEETSRRTHVAKSDIAHSALFEDESPVRCDSTWLDISRASPPPYPPGDTIGCTYYDFQQNGSMGRQVAWSSANNVVHFIWMCQTNLTGRRTTRYNARSDAGTGEWSWGSGADAGKDISQLGGGYPNCDVRSTGNAVISYHEAIAYVIYYTTSGYDTSPPDGTFELRDGASPPNCSGTESGSTEQESFYIWSKVDWQRSSGHDVRHVVSCETPVSASPPDEIKSIIYYRYVDNSPIPCVPNNEDTLGTFIDATYTVNPVVRSDPNSDRVAIVYLKPLYEADDPRDPCGWLHWQHDVVYLESSDAGLSFLYGGANYVNVTDYTEGGTLRTDELRYKAYDDLSALYDHNGVLHIVWSTPIFEVEGDEPCIPKYSSILWHWDSASGCITAVYDATHPENHCPGGPGAFNTSLAKMNISECFSTEQSQYGLFVSFTRFGAHTDPQDDDVSIDCSDNGMSNGDIFISGSSDGGLTWGYDEAASGVEGDATPTIAGSAVDITNTLTDSCSAGFCHSEHWSSMAKYSTDYLHLAYIDDNDAGAGVYVDEGVLTNNAFMYFRYPWFRPSASCELATSDSAFSIVIAPSDSNDCINNYADTVSIEIVNYGNQPLDFLVASESDWIHPIVLEGSLETGCASVDSITFVIGPVLQPGTYNGTISVEYSCMDGSGMATIDVYVETLCEYDSTEILCLHGDANGSEAVDIDDVVYTIGYIFTGGPPPVPNLCCADVNASCAIDIDDVVYLISYIFTGGTAPLESCLPSNCGPF